MAGLKAACLSLGLLALPVSPVTSRYPIARCLYQSARLLSCVVSRLVCFVVYFLSIVATPALRACSPASPDELFLDRHLDGFVCDGVKNQIGRYVRIIILF